MSVDNQNQLMTVGGNNELMDYYARDLEEDKSGFSMIFLIAIMLATFIAWAVYFELDMTVRAQGTIIANARTQIIQVADGGVLEELLVREGDTVKEGELLAVLEKERAVAKLQEEQARVTALEITLIRARAETGQGLPDFSEMQTENPQVVDAQQAYFTQRARKLKQQLGILQQSLGMVKTELQMNKSLLSTGDVSRIEVMKAQREVNNVLGQILEAKNMHLNEAHQEITKIEAELKSLRYKLDAANSVVEHTKIFAPVAGVVKYMEVSTLGGVLRQGDQLMEISPTEGGLIIEAKVKPADISQLKVGMSVFLKLDAYDPTIYGNLHGNLKYISSDTLTEKDASGRENIFYSVQVVVDEAHLASEPKLANVMLKPGMTVTIDVKTGSKTVLNYLAKPITRAFSGALH